MSHDESGKGEASSSSERPLLTPAGFVEDEECLISMSR